MCGRSRQMSVAPTLEASASQAVGRPVSWTPGSETWAGGANICPGKELPVLYQESSTGCLLLSPMLWGLVPSYTQLREGTKPDFFRLFNARSESVSEVKVFGRLLERRRCAVLLDGFYEWQLDWKKEKQPFYVRFEENERPLFVAGLYDVCETGNGHMHTVTLLTTQSCEALQWLHSRMPAFLEGDALAVWLNTATVSPSMACSLLVPFVGAGLSWYPVTKRINKLDYQANDCATAVNLSAPKASTSFFTGKKIVGRHGEELGTSSQEVEKGSSVSPAIGSGLVSSKVDPSSEKSHLGSGDRMIRERECADSDQVCAKCTFENPARAKACEVCRSSLGLNENADTGGSAVFDGVASLGFELSQCPERSKYDARQSSASALTVNACEACTFINSAGSQKCEMCLTLLRKHEKRNGLTAKNKRLSSRPGCSPQKKKLISSYFGRKVPNDGTRGKSPGFRTYAPGRKIG